MQSSPLYGARFEIARRPMTPSEAAAAVIAAAEVYRLLPRDERAAVRARLAAASA